MTLVKRLPLKVVIGTRPLEDVRSVWDDFPGDLWNIITNENVAYTTGEESGHLYIDPNEGRTQIARLSCDTYGNEAFSLVNSALYFQARPMDKHTFINNADDWNMAFTMYDFDTGFTSISIDIGGDGSDPTGTVDLLVFADVASGSDSFAYDLVQHRWWRFRHDGHDVVIESAPSCGSWTERLRVAWTTDPIDNLTLEWAMLMDPPESPPETAGYWGAFNQQPVPRSLPLKVTVGDVRAPSLIRRLPLLVQIGDASS